MSHNNQSEVSRAAQLIVSGSGEELYKTFKDFQRSNADDYTEKLPDASFDHPEIAGFISSGALVQVWRNRSRPNAHLMAVGDLKTGGWDWGELTNVSEEPNGDYSKAEGYATIGETDYRLKASPRRISLTEWSTDESSLPIKYPVKDYLELDGEVYSETKRQRAALMSRVLYVASIIKPNETNQSVSNERDAA